MSRNENYCDVVVIGGGLAGIRTAHLLSQKGFTVIVLEAKDRLGGRTETVAYNDPKTNKNYTFEVGAQWLAPASLQPAIHKLADGFKLQKYLQPHAGQGTILFRSHLNHYSGEVSNATEGLHKHDAVVDEINRLSKLFEGVDLEKESVQKTKLKDELNRFATPDHWLSAMCPKPEDEPTRAMFETQFRCLLTTEPCEMDWSFLVWFMHSGKGYSIHTDTHEAAQHEILIGGNQQLSDLMAKEVTRVPKNKVILKAPCFKIVQTKEGVVAYYVGTDNSLQKVHAKRAVVAIPPPLAARIQFDPPLPAERDVLYQRMKMGAVIKCFVIFKSAFWKAKGLSGETFTDEGPVCNYYDASSHDGNVPALIGLIAGRDALYWSKRSQAERKEAVLQQLVKIFGPDAAQPVHYIDKDWTDDQWQRGAYMAVMSPNLFWDAQKILRKPHHKVHFAGTETATEWYGYMEGALLSAERVAVEIQSAEGPSSAKSKL